MLERVRKCFGAHAALDGIDLVVARGSRTAIVGPSGSGKTTLLRLVAGFDAPDEGRIVLDGVLLADGPAMMPAHRRGVGVVAQDGALFPHLSVADNIGFGLDGSGQVRRGRVRELMALVELDPVMLDRRPDALSGGQQQRVALARALARQPRLMLLDEPFSALDTALRASTRKAVTDVLARAGITTVLVTHDQAEALSFADQVAVMRDGRLLQVGAPRVLYTQPVDAEVAGFLGDAMILQGEVAGAAARCALGTVGVMDVGRHGPGTLMVRPEQVTLTAVPGGGCGPGCAVVVAADFAGAVCSYTLRLADGSSLSLVQRGGDLLAPGASVRLGVHGLAHVFAGI